MYKTAIQLQNSQLQKILISLFILFNIYMVTIMAMPASWIWKEQLFRLMSPIVDFLGLTHYHQFYSPNPPFSERHVDFEILFNDGSSTYWQYPRDKVVFFDRSGSFHRYVQEYLWWGSTYNHAAFPYFAKFIVRQTSNEGHYPVKVSFLVSVMKTPPPETQYYSVGPRAHVFFQYP